ncbi:MAG: hypothetical protein WC766_01215 [Patescibacteria group bacterium]|jgi:hypothetical protein
MNTKRNLSQFYALFALFFILSLFVAGCGNDEFTGPTTDAGNDASADAKSDAQQQPDVVTDTTGDVQTDAAEDAMPETGTDAEHDAAIDGAVELMPGDLIKGATSGVYYYGEDLKRHLFPNEDTFYSWLTADDFNLVKTIPDQQLGALPTGRDVTIRPGTYLVKIQTDPKTYAITDCGHIHEIGSEAIAISLYGTNWAQRVRDVPESNWGQYIVSTPITVPVHPDGQLITYAGDANRYVVMNGAKRKIASQAAYDVNRWQDSFAIQTAIPYADGAPVTNYEPQIFWNIVCTP